MSASGDVPDTGMNIARLLTTLSISVVTLFTLIAAFNGAFGGGPFVNGFVQTIFGLSVEGTVDGAARILILMGALLVLSWGIDLWSGADSDRDVQSTAPFWIGLGAIGLLLIDFVVPEFVTDAIGVTGIVELLLGIPLDQIDSVQTAVLGVIFIAIFYAVRARLASAIEGTNTPGGGSASSVTYQVGQGFIGLARQYRDVLMRLGVFVGTTLGLLGIGVGTGTAGLVGEFVGTISQLFFQSPAWSGYVGSHLAYYFNFIFPDVPILTETELAVGLAMLMLISIGAAYSSRVQN